MWKAPGPSGDGADQASRQENVALDPEKWARCRERADKHPYVTDDRPRAVLAGGHDLDMDSATTEGVNTASDEWPYLGPISARIEAGDQKQASWVARLGNQRVCPLPVRDAAWDLSPITRATIWVPQGRPIIGRIPKTADTWLDAKVPQGAMSSRPRGSAEAGDVRGGAAR